jgi:HSP20 family molecular chaperone IbpA
MATVDPAVWMWTEACEFLERAERMQRQFFRPGGPDRRPLWHPPVDIFETDRAVLVFVALPGVEPDGVRIVIDAGLLIVAGERALPAETRDATIHRLEVPHGRFERRIVLPAGRFEVNEHTLGNGCLKLHLRKLG